MDDKLKRFEELFAEMQKCSDEMRILADEIRAAPEENNDTGVGMLSTYIKDIESGSTQYWLDSDGDVDNGSADYLPYRFNPYCNYNDDIYAEKAARMKKFTDILLAFKWCYDRDYEPDWSTNDDKYFVAYDSYNGRYDIDSFIAWLHPVVYFSSEDMAQKCVDWLNNIDPKGTLLLGTESNEKEVSI